MRTVETDVLIVGAGPTGLVAAAFLAQYGVDAITLSRYSGPAPQPRGSFTNQRSIEVLRDLGIEDRVHAVGTPLQSIGHNVMATSFAGDEIMRYESYGVGARLADYAQASPCLNYNLPQHVIEPVLLEAARDRGADVRYLHELQTIEQDADEVRAVVRDRESGEEYLVRAQYAYGADGGRSRVAEQLGFPFEGEAGLIHMANAWVEVDLTEYVEHRPAGQYIIMQPGGDSWVGSGTFVTVVPWTEWLFSREYDPNDGPPDLSDDAIVDAVRTLVGRDVPVTVKGTSLWEVNAVLALEYSIGRVFIGGDAAHRHSPSGGLGTNTSMQDAYNLAWKLAAVLRGTAGPELLETYHQERQPVGRQVVERAMFNLRNKAKVGEVLGLRRGQTADEGWSALRSLFADVPGGAERRRALTEVTEIQNGRSTAHGIDIGQRYTSDAVVDDGTPFPEPTRDPALYYHPTTHPGAHLPHVWLEKDRKRISTLDLVGQGRFTLIVGIGGRAWEEAVERVRTELGMDVAVVQVGYRCEYDDVVGDWFRIREIEDDGALLVRPDGHIAWRAMDSSTSTPDVLVDVLRRVLALPRDRASAGDRLVAPTGR
jgi:2,4-dichlorophenol 6-monooxygenase